MIQQICDNLNIKKYNIVALHSHSNELVERHNRSKLCLTKLLSFYRAIYQAAVKGLNYDVINLDFSKAFDRVPHQEVLTKESPLNRW